MPDIFTGEFCVWRVEYRGNSWRAVTYACRLNRVTRYYELREIDNPNAPIITDATLDDFYIFEDVAKAEADQYNELFYDRRCA